MLAEGIARSQGNLKRLVIHVLKKGEMVEQNPTALIALLKANATVQSIETLEYKVNSFASRKKKLCSQRIFKIVQEFLPEGCCLLEEEIKLLLKENRSLRFVKVVRI